MPLRLLLLLFLDLDPSMTPLLLCDNNNNRLPPRMLEYEAEDASDCIEEQHALARREDDCIVIR
jgi:hypothetical protein